MTVWCDDLARKLNHGHPVPYQIGVTNRALAEAGIVFLLSEVRGKGAFDFKDGVYWFALSEEHDAMIFKLKFGDT